MKIQLLSAFTFSLLVSAGSSATADDPIKRHPVGPDQPGLAWAATTEDVPLLFTTQVSGTRAEGPADKVAAQAHEALSRLAILLSRSGSSLDRAVKLNFYVTEDSAYDAVLEAVNARTSGQPVPVSFVRTRLLEPGALMAVDAVAQLPSAETAPRTANLGGLPPAAIGAHVGVLPPGRRVFLSGFAAREPTLAESVREVLDGQRNTMHHHGLDPSQVVQVKGWISPLDELEVLQTELARFFGPKPVPPVVLIEWTASGQAEIEFVLAGAKADPARFSGPLEFATRPGAPAPTRFSHIAFVEAAQPLIFFAGLYGRAGDPARQQLRDIYAQLGGLLFDNGSGFRYLVKATYHNTDSAGRAALGAIRDVYYDPARPAAASGVVVAGTGRAGHRATLEIIAVPLPRP